MCITDNIARVGEEDADSDPRYAIRLVLAEFNFAVFECEILRF